MVQINKEKHKKQEINNIEKRLIGTFRSLETGTEVGSGHVSQLVFNEENSDLEESLDGVELLLSGHVSGLSAREHLIQRSPLWIGIRENSVDVDSVNREVDELLRTTLEQTGVVHAMADEARVLAFHQKTLSVLTDKSDLCLGGEVDKVASEEVDRGSDDTVLLLVGSEQRGQCLFHELLGKLVNGTVEEVVCNEVAEHAHMSVDDHLELFDEEILLCVVQVNNPSHVK